MYGLLILENPLIGQKNSRTIKIPWFSSTRNISVSNCDILTLLFNIFLNKVMFWVFFFSFGIHFSIPCSHSMTPTICDRLLLKYMQILKWWSNRIYSINSSPIQQLRLSNIQNQTFSLPNKKWHSNFSNQPNKHC